MESYRWDNITRTVSNGEQNQQEIIYDIEFVFSSSDQIEKKKRKKRKSKFTYINLRFHSNGQT